MIVTARSLTGHQVEVTAGSHRFITDDTAVHGANLLKTRFFKPDVYSSYKAADHWVRFQYPFWWNNLVSALDSISLIGLPAADPDIQNAINWLVDHQGADGAWNCCYSKIHKSGNSKKYQAARLWVSLAICRIFKRLYD